MKKKFSLKIAGKISLGFGVLTLAVIFNTVLINNELSKSRTQNEKTSKVYQPSEALLISMQNLVNSSQMLIRSWVFVDKVPDTPDKLKLRRLHSASYPLIRRELERISDRWEPEDQKIYQSVVLSIDSLFELHREVMDKLPNLAAYDDPSIMFMVIPLVSDDGEITARTTIILKQLEKLVQNQRSKVVASRVEMEQSFAQLRETVVLTCIALVLVALLLAFVTVRSLVMPLNHIKKVLLSMSKGILPEKKIKEKNDEIGEMSKALNELVTGLKALSGIALEIGRGNYDSDFKPLSEEDVLGNSLLRMRDDLKAAAIEDAKRKQEDEHRNWASMGVAKFSDILRQNNDRLDMLSYEVISNLVDYLGANQGGIFLVNDNDNNPYIELVSCYAFNRKKHYEKRIEMGEGLVGRCIMEKEPIYLTDVPDNYIKITSGLGDANPRSLLLVPLALNEKVFGVIEIASFNPIEPYQIEFVVKIAEIIASTLSTVRINMQTTQLLEQSKIQAEELVAQEEEMRQNMEELRATQEESSRKEMELKHTVEELQKKVEKK
jgi:Methyl-accepting chemotaxis protein